MRVKHLYIVKYIKDVIKERKRTSQTATVPGKDILSAMGQLKNAEGMPGDSK